MRWVQPGKINAPIATPGSLAKRPLSTRASRRLAQGSARQQRMRAMRRRTGAPEWFRQMKLDTLAAQTIDDPPIGQPTEERE